jgi:Txe/YoeB family toxin of Txe-Axe toxin-antitoxin module
MWYNKHMDNERGISSYRDGEIGGVDMRPEVEGGGGERQDIGGVGEHGEGVMAAGGGAAMGQTSFLPPVISSGGMGLRDDAGVVKNTNPDVAEDNDKIEKEWVDRAKDIVNKTRDDPWLRDEEVKGLKADYLHKRFGRRIGDRNG